MIRGGRTMAAILRPGIDMVKVSRPKSVKKKRPDVPFGARRGGALNPERYPVIPKVPGTRDTGGPRQLPKPRKKRRIPRVK